MSVNELQTVLKVHPDIDIIIKTEMVNFTHTHQPGISRNLVVKSKLPPRSGPVALRQLNPIHKKGS